MNLPRLAVCFLLCLTVCGAIAVAGSGDESPNRVEVKEHRLVITEADLTTQINYEKGGKETEHEIQLDAEYGAPDADEYVAVTKDLWALQAIDVDDNTVRVDNGGKRDTVSQTFVPLIRGASEVKLRRVNVPINPHRIAQLDVQARAIRVEEQEEHKIAAHVSETPTAIGNGLSLRVEEMEIKRNGSAKVKVEMTRGGAAGSPFIVAVFILDKDGKELGGGRWNEGKLDLRSTTYMFESDFEVRIASPIAKIKALVATKHSVEDITFPIKGLMQE